MLSALKSMDKKFLIMAGAVIGLPILLIVFLAVLRGCGNSKISHEAYEEKMITAAEKYMKQKKKEPTEEGEVLTVKLSTLVKEEYIKSTEKLLEDTTCEGSVYIRRNGASVEATSGGYLDYIVNLECKDYKTTTLADKIKENVVTEDSGLYQVEDEYIFKGNKVKNYILFFENTYRIMGIDKNGIIKLIKTEAEANTKIWDNKYNVETNRNSGKNIYKDSLIKDYLINDYMNVKKFSLEAREKVVAYDACIGKRSVSNVNIDSALDCSEVLEKQVVSLMNVSDYAKASLDVDCTTLRSPACNNYNYLYGVAYESWTLNSSLENSYDVLFVSGGMMSAQAANTYSGYNLVVYIDGNQKYISGSGSSNDPYIVQ